MKQVHEITYNGITYKDGDIIKFKWGLDNSFTFIGEIQAIADTFDFITIVEIRKQNHNKAKYQI